MNAWPNGFVSQFSNYEQAICLLGFARTSRPPHPCWIGISTAAAFPRPSSIEDIGAALVATGQRRSLAEFSFALFFPMHRPRVGICARFPGR